MSQAVFVDTNVPIYAAGREHPNKESCARILLMAAEHPRAFVTDVEVLQELLHRYVSSGRWALGRQVLQGFTQVMHDRIENVRVEDMSFAARLADGHPGISARDLVHAAVMRRLGVSQIVSTDADFDRLPALTRLDPSRAEEWADSVLGIGYG